MTRTTRRTTKSKGLTQKQVGRKYGFRSGLEERTGAALTRVGVAFEFEQQVIHYVKPEQNSRYTPDFVITHRPDGTPRRKPLIVETKGRFMVKDRQKHKLVKKQHPELDIRFVFSNPNQKISKTSKTTYAAWCEKNGFQYAKETIPREWLEE